MIYEQDAARIIYKQQFFVPIGEMRRGMVEENNK
jgi:hypothetical protein